MNVKYLAFRLMGLHAGFFALTPVITAGAIESHGFPIIAQVELIAVFDTR